MHINSTKCLVLCTIFLGGHSSHYQLFVLIVRTQVVVHSTWNCSMSRDDIQWMNWCLVLFQLTGDHGGPPRQGSKSKKSSSHTKETGKMQRCFILLILSVTASTIVIGLLSFNFISASSVPNLLLHQIPDPC